jgi:hypothetical protein
MVTALNIDTKVKYLIALAFVILSFVFINGVRTYRLNYQKMFAASVQKKIGIDTIRVRTDHDVLVLDGVGSAPQIRYAEKIAQTFIEKYGPSATNPPKGIRNQIKAKNVAASSPVSGQRLAAVRE